MISAENGMPGIRNVYGNIKKDTGRNWRKYLLEADDRKGAGMDKEKDAKLIKIELNKRGDYIAVSTADTDLFDRFVMGYRQIVDMAAELPQKYKDIEQRYVKPCIEKTVEIARVNVAFSNDAIEIIDNIFGKHTIKKYFRKLYKKVPDFLPGTECFIDFFNQMCPVWEELFGRRVDDSEKEHIRSMGQYVHFGI